MAQNSSDVIEAEQTIRQAHAVCNSGKEHHGSGQIKITLK
jgi:hypothetical protein